MSGSKTILRPVAVKATQTKRQHRDTPFSSERSKIWFDSDRNSGDEREDDGDVDSMSSAASDDSVKTPEQSPPQHRQAILQSRVAVIPPAVGYFDAEGNWTWSVSCIKQDGMHRPGEGQSAQVQAETTHRPPMSELNRHDRAQIAMTGSIRGLSSQQRASFALQNGLGDEHELSEEEDDDDDPLDLVGFTSYHPHGDSNQSEGHSI